MFLGNVMVYKADYPEALMWLERAHAGFARSGDRQGLGQVSGRIGIIARLQGNYAHAHACFEQQARMATERDDKDELAEALGHTGNVYNDQGDFARAQDCYERSLAISAATGNRREGLYAIGNMGAISFRTGDYARAQANFGRALDTALEIGDQHSVVVAAVNIGEVYRAHGDAPQALASALFALQAALELDERMMVALAVANIAWIYMGQELHDRAGELFSIAITLARALHIPYYLVDALYGQAELSYSQGDYAAAQEVNQQAITIAQEIAEGDIQIKAQILALHLRVALGQADHVTVASECQALLQQWPEAVDQAALHYALWRFNGLQELRQQAATLYGTLYANTPNVEYRRRLEELTGEPVAAPPPLPALPDSVTRGTASLNALLVQVNVLLLRAARSKSDATQ